MRMHALLLTSMLLIPSCVSSSDEVDANVARCQGKLPTIQGDERNDVLRGTGASDVISGLGGDDVLLGLGGDDILCGGTGDDTLKGDEGFDELVGDSGADDCYGGADGAHKGSCEDATILAAGDIACDPAETALLEREGAEGRCQQQATSDLLTASYPKLVGVLMLGDSQYGTGAYEDFLRSYDPTWGRMKELTHPVPGNNEYESPDATGYFRYFGGAAGPSDAGYYSFDLEGWHFIALNSLCWRIGGCGRQDPQVRWLRRDLAASEASCNIAFFHHPRFASGATSVNHDVEPIWHALYEAGVDIVLNGHHHYYERFLPLRPSGVVDETQGIRQFIVGTGGVNLEPLGTPDGRGAAWNDSTYGVLELTLHAGSYEWRFLTIAGGDFADVGADRCN